MRSAIPSESRPASVAALVTFSKLKSLNGAVAGRLRRIIAGLPHITNLPSILSLFAVLADVRCAGKDLGTEHDGVARACGGDGPDSTRNRQDSARLATCGRQNPQPRLRLVFFYCGIAATRAEHERAVRQKHRVGLSLVGEGK